MKTTTNNSSFFRRAVALLPLLCLLFSFASCSDDPSGKPASSNRPYQVLLVNDSGHLLTDELRDTVSGLPQPEPSFDIIIATPGNKTPWQQLSRSIVQVKFNKDSTRTHISIARDVYAKPQIVLTVTSKSPEQFSSYMHSHPGQIRKILNAFELSCAIHSLKSTHNPQAEKTIHDMFGIDILIPADLTASKRGRDFIWLSNNTNEGLENICVYRVKAGKGNKDIGIISNDAQFFRHVRDSVMKINIPGERSGMYMETASIVDGCWVLGDNDHQDKRLTRKPSTPITQHPSPEMRGLWDMRGDAMGGPFIARCITAPPYIIYIEGFVYAPESKKRNKLRRLEASILTGKVKSKKVKTRH